METSHMMILLACYGLVFMIDLYTTRKISEHDDTIHGLRQFNQKTWEL